MAMQSKFSVLCGAFALWFSAAAGAADLTAAQIVERNAAARGGLEAWRAVNTLAMTGEMEAGGKSNTRLPFEMRLKRPQMSRLEISVQNRTAVQTWDGKQGWKLRPYLGRNDVEPLTKAEAASAAAADELDGPLLDHARKGIKVALEGRDQVEGKDTYRLLLSQAGRPDRHLWVDAQSFLEVRIDGQPRKLDGRPHAVSVYFRDFRKEGALTVPHTLETAVAGVRETHKILIKSISVNGPMADAMFGKPSTVAQAARPGAL